MANDNNKINDLVSEADDDLTSELESLNPDVDTASIPHLDDDVDEDTFDFERFEDAADLPEHSIQSLKSGIRTRNESISRLKFDIEQLRARWIGFEKEIKAREELTDRLNAELSAAKATIKNSQRSTLDHDAAIDALQINLDDKSARLEAVESEALSTSKTVDAGKTVIKELQDKVAEQQSTIKKQKNEIRNTDQTAKKSRSTRSREADRIAKLQRNIEQQSAEVNALKQKIQSAEKDLRKSHKKNEKLEASAQATKSRNRNQQEQQLQQQTGLLSSNHQELDALKQQIVRTEAYADTLRMQLADVGNDREFNARKHGQLEQSLQESTSHTQKLISQLGKEQQAHVILQEKYDDLQNSFDDEIRKIRFELGSAQETLTGQESLNEQLASDLIDNQGYRQALESQIESSEKESKKLIRDLERKVRKLSTRNEDLNRKVENKDSAIAALLNELASRSRTIESIGEIENVIHEIDGRMSDRDDQRADTERDRTARLLIGIVDGQELQFPLFKDRLTIGRTEDNDIQLKAQFISRRHALIVTEDGVTRIVDWGSKNGVYVNDSRIVDQNLKNGDIVAIGAAEFRYEERAKR